MRRHRTAAGILLAVGALLTGGLAGAGAADAAAPEAASGPSAAVRTASAAEQHTSRTFWTAERMRGATPLDLLLIPKAAKSLKSPASSGRSTTVAPTASPASFPQAGGPWTGGGGVVTTSGRVFFTFQGRTASCTGNAVTSQNASTVITAGHCVKYQGSRHTNWVFVPAYNTAMRRTASGPRPRSSPPRSGRPARTSTTTSARRSSPR